MKKMIILLLGISTFILAAELDTLLYENFDAQWTTEDPPPGWVITWTGEGPNRNDWHRTGGLHGFPNPTRAWAHLSWRPEDVGTDILMSPVINCSNHYEVTLTAWAYYDHHAGQYTARIEGSADGGETWPHIIRDYESRSFKQPSYRDGHEVFPLSWAAGEKAVRIRWYGQGNSVNITSWSVDDVVVTARHGVLQNDMATVSIDNQQFHLQPGMVHTIRATVENRGVQPQDNVPVVLDVTGPDGYRHLDTTYTGAVAPRTTEQIALDWNVPPQGDYYYDVIVRTALAGDEHPDNDAALFELNRQSFLRERFPPVGWTQIVTHSEYPDFTWHRRSEPIPPEWHLPYRTPPAGAGLGALAAGNYRQNEWLISPEFTVSPGSMLTWWFFGFVGSRHGDHYYTKITTDNGATWDVLYDLTDQPGGDFSYWEEPVTVSLVDYAGQTAKIAFHAQGSPAQLGIHYLWFIDDIQVTAPTVGVADRGGPTGRFEPVRLYPNPTAGRTDVRFALPHHSPTQVRVFAVDGTLVRTLTEGMLAPGRHILTWDGTDDTGRQVSRGIYYVRVNTAGFTGTEKLVRVQ